MKTELKNKDVTIGALFGRLAFLICYLKIFSTTSDWIFNPMLKGGMSNFTLMFICIFSLLCFIVQFVTFGYYVEAYLIKHNFLKNESESEDNII